MRSIQTIRDCTNVIAEYPTKHSVLQVLKLANESLPVDKQTYIAVFKKDIGIRSTHVKPLAEARYIDGKVMFTVKPKKQYPNMHELENYKKMISDSIVEFVHKQRFMLSDQ